MPGEHLCQSMAQAASESAASCGAFFRSGLVSMRSGWNLRVADAFGGSKGAESGGWARCQNVAAAPLRHPSGEGSCLGPRTRPGASGQASRAVRGRMGGCERGHFEHAVALQTPRPREGHPRCTPTAACLVRVGIRAKVRVRLRVPLRRACVAPILVTLHELQVVRLRPTSELLLVDTQHPRLRCQGDAVECRAWAHVSRACRTRIP